jgi:hypothetical protein
MEDRTYEEDKPSEEPSGDEDTNPAKGTPSIGRQGQEHGQTQSAPAGDETGIPPDEEMDRKS